MRRNRRLYFYTILFGVVNVCWVYVLFFNQLYSEETLNQSYYEEKTFQQTEDMKCMYNTMDQKDLDYTPKVINQLCENIYVYDSFFVHLQNTVINPDTFQMSFSRDIGDNKKVNNKGNNSNYRHNADICSAELDQDSLDYYRVPENVKIVLLRNIQQATTLNYNRTDNVVTIAIKITDVMSVYSIVRQWYDVYLLANHFKEFSNCRINVLFLDHHSNKDIDSLWNILFSKIKTVEDIKTPKLYKNLIWLIPERISPIADIRKKELPMIESFRKFVLLKFESYTSEVKNCRKLNIVLIQNSSPIDLSEKIVRNVEEILKEIRERFPLHEIEVLPTDIYSLPRNLPVISVTNILIGIHGTGMASVIYLPKASGVIEIFPIDTPTTDNEYKRLARHRKLDYISWQNVRRWDDFKQDNSMYIPPKIITFLLKQMFGRICVH